MLSCQSRCHIPDKDPFSLYRPMSPKHDGCRPLRFRQTCTEREPPCSPWASVCLWRGFLTAAVGVQRLMDWLFNAGGRKPAVQRASHEDDPPGAPIGAPILTTPCSFGACSDFELVQNLLGLGVCLYAKETLPTKSIFSWFAPNLSLEFFHAWTVGLKKDPRSTCTR